MHSVVPYLLQNAAGRASNPDKPPFYFDMPVRMVDGKAEIVPDVAAKIIAQDSTREAQRYVEQPLRLRGILIMHELPDQWNPTEVVGDFDKLLTDLAVDHEYEEVDASHCVFPWQEKALKFMSDRLAVIQ